MKKNLLSALALSICSISFGQAIEEKINFNSQEPATEVKNNSSAINNKTLGAVIWTNNFDTPAEIAEWTIDNNAQTGAAFGWTIGTNVDGWWSTAGIVSTSGGNFAELSNGDPTATPETQALGVTYTLTSTNSIDLIALGNAQVPAVNGASSILEFEQYGARFRDLTEIQISTDGTNFTTVGDNFDFNIHSTASSNVWPNPNIKRVNLAPFLTAATATTVWIRFSWTTNFAGSTTPNDWVAYGWYIDDVKIVTSPTNDLSISEPYFGTAAYTYSRIPVNQIQPIEFTAKATNEGAVDQTNAVLSVDISGATTTSTPQTILTGATDSLVAATWTPPTTTGVPYNVTFILESDSIDDVPTSDSAFFPEFEITDNVYAYDDYGTPGAGGGDDAGVAEFEAGNSFDIFVDDDLYSIDVVIGAGTPDGTNIEGVLYDFTATGFVKIVASAFHSTTTAEIGSVVHLLFPNPPTLVAGKTYFAAVHTIATTFYYGTSGASSDGSGAGSRTSYLYYPTMDNPNTGQNFYTTSTPMVRMNFDETLVGINELNNSVAFNVFPNPSNGVFNINLSSNDDKNVNLTVKNVVGQTVLTETVNVSGKTNHTISLADYSKGIYFLTVGNETVKLVVE